MAQPDPYLLTTGQAAKLCEVAPDTILKWIRKGRLRGTRTAGGHYRINPRDLQPHVRPGRLKADRRGNGQTHADRQVRGLSTNVLVISSDEPLLQRLSSEDNDSIVLQTARSAYEASAAVQVFPAAFVIVDQELVATEEKRLLHALSTDPRLTGAKIVLCVPHGATTNWDTESRGYEEDIVFGTIEKPFGLRRIAAVINSFPIELSAAADPSKKRK